MASRIKGITVEIGGDTSGLEKSLSDVNNSIKKTQSQLRDVNNLLKRYLSPIPSFWRRNRNFFSRRLEILRKNCRLWNKHRRMWRKPLSGAILGKTSTWLSNVK